MLQTIERQLNVKLTETNETLTSH